MGVQRGRRETRQPVLACRKTTHTLNATCVLCNSVCSQGSAHFRAATGMKIASFWRHSNIYVRFMSSCAYWSHLFGFTLSQCYADRRWWPNSTCMSSVLHQAGDPMIWPPPSLTCIYPLILLHTADNELSKNKKHISLALSVAELWTSKVDEHWSKILLKIQTIVLCSCYNVFNVHLFIQFKTVLHK